MNPVLQAYIVAVEEPEASGFEHLQMLDLRDELESVKDQLSAAERQLLRKSDQQLLSAAKVFHLAIAEIVDLPTERIRHNPPATHWWWYLDVLAQLAVPDGDSGQSPEVVFA